MTGRIKILVHLRRLSGLFERAIRNGPDGTLDGNHGSEHPAFVHYSLGFYLAGCMAYLEGEDGAYSWNKPSQVNAEFDAFAASNPKNKEEFCRVWDF